MRGDNVKTQALVNCFNTCGLRYVSTKKIINDINALGDAVIQLFMSPNHMKIRKLLSIMMIYLKIRRIVLEKILTQVRL